MKKKKIIWGAGVLLFCLFLFNGQASSRVYVDAGGSEDSSCGGSWSTACKYIQDAINKATAVNNEIWVKEGIYTLKSLNECEGGAYDQGNCGQINVDESVKLYGGFPGDELNPTWGDRDWIMNETIVDAGCFYRNEQGEDQFNCPRENPRRCFYITANNVTIDGFTITGGTASLSEQESTDDQAGGAAIRIGPHPQVEYNGTNVENCKIIDNYSY